MGTYTSIAKKRVEQSKELVAAQQATPTSPETKTVHETKNEAAIPISNEKRSKRKSAKDGKHQISGWVQMEYFEKFIKLHRNINPLLSEKVEKQFMLGLAIDTLCKIIGDSAPVFNSEEEFKHYLDQKLKDKL